MSCDICHGMPNCPVCTPEVETEICMRCQGEGMIYFDTDGKEMDYTEWEDLPEDDRMSEKCDVCGGEGVLVINEFE